MFDRRLMTDVGLAILIAFPTMLPAATSPRSEDVKVSKAADHTLAALAEHSDRVRAAERS